MPRNATTGAFARVSNSFSQPVFGTLIDPTDADSYFDDLDAGLNPAALAGAATPFGAGTLTGLTVVSTPSFNARNGTTIANGVGANGSGGTIIFWDQPGSFAAPTAIPNQKELGSVSVLGWTGSAWGPPAQNTAVVFVSTEAWTPTANGSGILFQATRNGTTVAINEVSIEDGVTVMTPGQFTQPGLGAGTLNAQAGVYDNSKRVVSASSPTIALTSASAFSVGQNGATNPAFVVNTVTASSVTGISISSQAAAGGVSLSAISSTTNEPIAFNAKGSGQITIGNVSTGPISLSRAIIYGGVTLSNAVTGTGNMVLSADPTLTGTTTVATLIASTSETVPLVIGGAAAASTLTLESTSGAGTTDAIIFKTASQTERGRITTGGLWSIGGSGTAKTFLDINANSSSSPALVVSTSLARMQAADGAFGGMEWVSYGSPAGNVLSGVTAGGTAASPTATPANNNMFNLRGYGYNGTSFQSGALIIMLADSLWSGTNQASRTDFYTTPTNSTTITRAMVINPSGGVSIGTTALATDYGLGNLGVAGFASAAATTKTANYPMTVADSSLIFNGAGSLTLTLLAAATYPGRWLILKTIAAQTVVSNASNVVPQAGGAAGTAILAATAGKWAWLQSDGTNWQIMASN